ncbi:hemerythrin domain-containing protein [Ammoniphilus sp. YIM 78166]|uniref:hemerythrin domain-containing protein n=1 Tax=Ammoniphilus sp. YIM 78166 TaxID=1644106 RepID=UPI00106FB513|nr:hemerythrin domain-containing protein [Ammoniphilus sp. YIM 78166]
MNIADAITLLLEQHEEIRSLAKEAMSVLERTKENASTEDYELLLEKLITLKARLVEHGRKEEELIVPILQDMYHPQAEMARYVEDEHTHMEEELKEIKKHLREHILNKSERLEEVIYSKAKTFLTQTITHLFEEESGLFPMLKGFLSQVKK